jgi:HlyD family secretion protein
MNLIKNILKKKKIIIPLIIIIAVILFFVLRSDKPEYEFAEVKRGDVVQEIEVSGELKTIFELNLSFQNSGQVSYLPIKEGQKIRSGQLLAQLNLGELNAKEAEAQANLAATQADLNKLLFSTQTSLGNAYDDSLPEIEKSRLRSIDSIDTLNKLFETTGLIKSKYQNNNIQLRINLTDNYAAAKAALEEVRNLANKTSLTQTPKTIDEALMIIPQKMEVIRSALENARDFKQTVLTTSEVSSTDINTLLDDISTAAANLNIALIALIDARQEVEAQKTNNQESAKQAEIEAAEAKIEKAEAALNLIRAQISNSQILAPLSGTISEIEIELGEYASPNTPAITLISSEDYKIEANVPESDITQIQKDQKVTINFDALLNETFEGHVELIKPRGKAVEGVIYYQTVILIDQQDARLKPGMSADISFDLPSRYDVLTLPQRAIFEKAEQSYVRILDENEKIQEVFVKIGLIGTNGFTEIIEGINEGQSVIVRIKDNK